MRGSLAVSEEFFVSFDSKESAVKRVPAFSPPAR
jgi:hypothetical protein